MHGVTLRLATDHAPLAAYARQHLGRLAAAPGAEPDLEVVAHWSEGAGGPGSAVDVPGPEKIGKRMRGDEAGLQWLEPLRMKGLELHFRRLEDRWRFDIHYRYTPKPPEKQRPHEEYKRYFSLMSYLVYYPLLWRLERTRGLVVLHASALASPHGGILIGGVGGVGKTTTCIALLRRPGISLLSENLVLTDGAAVYPCDEPVRLDAASIELLGEVPEALEPMAYPGGLKEKSLYHPVAPWDRAVEPRAVFLPVFSERRGPRPLAPGVAAEKFVAMNRLAREVDDYAWYAAALDLHWPEPGVSARRIEALRMLAEHARCFELGIDRSAGVEAVVDDILEAVR
jgi:hypothetical protein